MAQLKTQETKGVHWFIALLVSGFAATVFSNVVSYCAFACARFDLSPYLLLAIVLILSCLPPMLVFALWLKLTNERYENSVVWRRGSGVLGAILALQLVPAFEHAPVFMMIAVPVMGFVLFKIFRAFVGKGVL